MFRLLTIPFLLLIFSLSTKASVADITSILDHKGRERSYIIHVPNDYNSKKSYPLVIALHGGKGTAKRFNRSTNFRFNELADKENFIIAYPQGVDKSWNDNNKRNPYGEARTSNIDDVGFIEQMINKLSTNYSIDTNYVFACGISNGGLMSATLATRLSNKITAIGMVASNFSEAHLKEMEISKPQPFSIIIIHGTEDPIFPYKEGEIAVFKQKRGLVIGVERSISFMCNLNGNSLSGIETKLPDTDTGDGCSSVRIIYPNLNNPTLNVELVNIIGGGHTWPGGNQYLSKRIIGLVTKDFNAADLLWEFFKKRLNEIREN